MLKRKGNFWSIVLFYILEAKKNKSLKMLFCLKHRKILNIEPEATNLLLCMYGLKVRSEFSNYLFIKTDNNFEEMALNVVSTFWPTDLIKIYTTDESEDFI